MLFKSKQFECAMLLICYIASLKGGDKLKEEARIFIFFLLLCGDVFKLTKSVNIKIKKLSRMLNQTLRTTEHTIERRRFAFYSFI